MKYLSIIAAAMVVAVPATASVQSATVKKAIRQIDTSDLDLRSSEGQAGLVKRIESASHSVCVINMFGQPATRNEKTKCKAATTAALKAHFRISVEAAANGRS